VNIVKSQTDYQLLLMEVETTYPPPSGTYFVASCCGEVLGN